MSKRKFAMGVGAAALVLGGVAGVAGFANADPSTRAVDYVDGFGEVTDDFNDHEREAGVLCAGCENSSDTDLVVLWQSILAADGMLWVGDIDGVFGSDTEDATQEWQGSNGLEPTGEVDQATWAKADDFLKPGSEPATVLYASDSDGSVYFGRTEDSDGAYTLKTVTDMMQDKLHAVSQDERIWLFERSITWKD